MDYFLIGQDPEGIDSAAAEHAIATDH